MNKELAELYKNDERIRLLLDTSRALEGVGMLQPTLPAWSSQESLVEHVPCKDRR